MSIIHSDFGRHLLAVLACVALLAPDAPAAPFPADSVDVPTLVAAINKAGRQRMLTQRVAKEYLLIGLGVEPDSSRQRLIDAVELFNSQHRELERFAASRPEMQALLGRIGDSWGEFEAIALGPVTLEGARMLVAQPDPSSLSRDERLLELCDRLAIELEVSSVAPLAYYVNLAGRQRMLTQRIAKYYMMLSSGFDNDLVRSGLAQAQQEFEGALDAMEEMAVTEGIRRDLGAAREQWNWLKSALTFERQDLLSGRGVFFPKIIEETSEKTLLVLDRLTRRFEQLASAD